MEPPGEFDVSLQRIAVGVAPDGIGETFFDEPAPILELETAAGSGDPSLVFRRTLGMFATGVTVITVRVGEVMHGMTANAFMSVSLRPPLILISIDRRAKMNALLREGVRYGVSVLEEGQVRLSDRFAGREADGSAPRQLTANARRNYAPAVSPDGRHIALHSNRTGAWNIWMVDADGGNPRPLTADNKTDSNWPQISPDGQWVIFHRPSAGGRFRLWKAPIAGGQETQITGETCMRPAVSPRDGMIACWYSEPSSQPQWRIGIYPPEGGRPVKTLTSTVPG